jgi:catechol 2,3-dioxygenase-like lactoylglutathione lyase family enzyme
MSTAPDLQFSHLGIYVTDLALMRAFYTRAFGFTVTDEGLLERPDGTSVQLVFLSRDPREHHQLVLAAGRPESSGFNIVNQISFRVPDLDALRRLRTLLDEEPVTELRPVTHGNAVSLYFRDPEGNRIEVFFDTPWYVSQPLAVPVDLSLDDDDLMARVEIHARALPGFEPVGQWRARLAQRMRAEQSEPPRAR